MVWGSWVVWVLVAHGGLEVGFDCCWCWVVGDFFWVCLSPFGDVAECGVVFVAECVDAAAECVHLVLEIVDSVGELVGFLLDSVDERFPFGVAVLFVGLSFF